MQIIVPKMTEIASAQGSESARQLQASQQNADSARAMVHADVREVHAQKNAQAVTMRTDREREGDGGYGRGGRRGGKRGGAGRGASQGGGANQQADRDGNRRTHIDIRL